MGNWGYKPVLITGDMSPLKTGSRAHRKVVKLWKDPETQMVVPKNHLRPSNQRAK